MAGLSKDIPAMAPANVPVNWPLMNVIDHSNPDAAFLPVLKEAGEVEGVPEAGPVNGAVTAALPEGASAATPELVS